jgi:hypothetical protein
MNGVWGWGVNWPNKREFMAQILLVKGRQISNLHQVRGEFWWRTSWFLLSKYYRVTSGTEWCKICRAGHWDTQCQLKHGFHWTQLNYLCPMFSWISKSNNLLCWILEWRNLIHWTSILNMFSCWIIGLLDLVEQSADLFIGCFLVCILYITV